MTKQEYKKIQSTLNFQPSWIKSTLRIIFNLMTLGLAITLFNTEGVLTYLISIPLFALAMIQSNISLHETTHESFLPGKKANIIAGHLYSIITLIPYFPRRDEHIKHHVWNGTFVEPAVTRAKEVFRKENSLAFKITVLCFKCWIPIFATIEICRLWKMATFSAVFKIYTRNKSAKHAKYLISGLIPITTILFIVIGAKLRIGTIASFLPAIYLYFILIEYFNLPHHLDSEVTDSKRPVPMYQQNKTTKSCEPLPLLNSWLTLNFNYHVAHHFFPNLPWHELKKAHQALADTSPDIGMLHNEYVWHKKTRKMSAKEIFAPFLDHN